MKRLFAEWEQQSSLIFALPHQNTDWKPYLKEIQESYKEFIKTVSKFQTCVVICNDKKEAKKLLEGIQNVTLFEIPTNDTWIRDFGAIDVQNGKNIQSYDFVFNAWGGKFDSSLDNMVNKSLHEKCFYESLHEEMFILEGGSIDCNGNGVMLTTSKCLLEENRNCTLNKDEIDKKLKELFGLKDIVWLQNGFLKGDDTDSHVDTLARFINKNTIAYTTCDDEKDEHYEELKNMEKELQNTHFNLVKLPIPQAKYFENHRLPATYANFVFVNGALVVPTYNDKNDEIILKRLQENLPNHKIIGVDASVFIRQHGSLHCATMNRHLNMNKPI